MAAKTPLALYTGTPDLKELQVGDTMAVTWFQVTADARLLGRVSGADGVVEELTKAQVLSLINVADGATVGADWTVTQTTTGNFTFKLSDNAGASKVSITDSDDAEVASVDSDGLLSSASLLSTGGYIRTSNNQLDITLSDSGSETDSDVNISNTDLSVQNTMYIGWSGSAADAGNSSSLRLYRDADHVLAQRLLTSNQTFRIYGTYTDASNYERLSISGDGTITTEAAGTGTDQGVKITNKLTIDPDQNFGAGTGLMFGDGNTGFRESSDNSLRVVAGGLEAYSFDNTYIQSRSANGFSLKRNGVSSTVPAFGFLTDENTGVGLAAADQLSLIAGGVEGVRISEAAAAITVESWGTNYIYGSYTDASNYERLSISGDGTITTEAAGTGTDQGVKITNKLTIDPDQNFGTTTGLMFGDGNTGFYEASDNNLYLYLAGGARWQFRNETFTGTGNLGPVLNRTPSASSPAFTFNADSDTGLYLATTDVPAMVAGGVEAHRWTESAGAIVHDMTGVATLITGHTIAGLPTPAVGMIARITDGDAALAWGATAVNSGAGATPYLVWYNGTNWTILGS